MKKFKISSEERAGFFKKISPIIARDMSKALQIFSSENIKLEFINVKTLNVKDLFVDIGEKCFGSHLNFKSLDNNVEGLAIAIFPLSEIKVLNELLLKKFFKKNDKVEADHELKLSAFKEAVNILLLTYITGIANALKVHLKNDVPKFDCFHNIELVKPTLLRGNKGLDNFVSIGQFRITSPHAGATTEGNSSAYAGSVCQRTPSDLLLRGALLLYFNRNSI